MSSDLLVQLNMLLLAEGNAQPLQFRLDTMIFSLLIFAILVLLLARYAWKPIMEGLEKRETNIANDINDAKSANEKAQALLAQYEQKLQAAQEETSNLIAEAKADAQRAREKILADANEEAQRQRDKAVAEINAAKDQAVRDLAQRSVDSAVALAGSLVEKELNASDHQKLIEQSLQRFGQSS